jgi:hypothetical protein
VFAATSPLLAHIGGVYLLDNDVSPIDDEVRGFSPTERVPAEVCSSSIDPADAKRLWALSVRLIGRAE